jgi:predicted transcriptional regulator
MAARRNKISNNFILKAFHATYDVRKTARRVGMSFVQVSRRLNKLGLCNTKTGRSR